jgi:GH25 family lysozyme M1 (1,4-beta-N-acetylmuramidase)
VVVGGRPCRRVVDLSSNNTVTSPADVVAQGDLAAVVIKATEGVNYANRFFAPWSAQFRATGIPVCAYHFAHPGASGAVQQADFLLSLMDQAGVTCGALDFEVSEISAQAGAVWADEFLRELAKHHPDPHLHYRGLYSSQSNYPPLVNFDLWLAGYPAGYAANPDPTKLPLPGVPAPWSNWAAWQFTSSEDVPGTVGHADLSVATVEWLAKLTGTPAPIPPQERTMPTQTVQDARDNKVWEVDGVFKNWLTSMDQLQATDYINLANGGKAMIVVNNAPGYAWLDSRVDVQALSAEKAAQRTRDYLANPSTNPGTVISQASRDALTQIQNALQAAPGSGGVANLQPVLDAIAKLPAETVQKLRDSIVVS